MRIHDALIRYLLEQRMQLPEKDWTMQGFGFLRLRLDENTRLHVWDSRLRQPEVSDIHDHAQWAFTSYIVSGCLINVRFAVGSGQPYHTSVINCGIGGGMRDICDDVRLEPKAPELYLPVSHYRQEPDEIHRTFAADGTVTLVRQERTDTGTARVFWPVGGTWGDAIPRQATRDEVFEVGAYALSIFAPFGE